MDSLLVFRRNSVILNQWTERNDRSLKMVSQKVSHMGSSHQTRDLWRFEDRCNTPWNLPSNFHSDLIATIRQRCLPLLSALLFQQSHLFLICVVSTYNDSRKDLHRLCHTPRNCQCKWPYDSFRAPGTFASFFEFPVKFLFCTDTLGSIEWLSPAPRLHIGDCFEIHSLHWGPCDLLLSNHQKIAARGTAPLLRLLHGALVIFVLWQISQFRFSGKWV